MQSSPIQLHLTKAAYDTTTSRSSRRNRTKVLYYVAFDTGLIRYIYPHHRLYSLPDYHSSEFWTK